MTQRTLDFNPIELTDRERARLRRDIDAWTREEQTEDFEQLPGESLSDFFRARDAYLSSLDAFGPTFPRLSKASEAARIMRGERKVPEPPM